MATFWLDKITDDLAEGVKGIKKEITKTSNKASNAVAGSKVKHSNHIYYGYSIITIDADMGRWTIVKEKESVFAQDLTNYTKVTTNKPKVMCLVGAKPARFKDTKPQKEDLLVTYGDIVILWTQIGMGRYLRPTLLKGYAIFDQEMPEIGPEMKGASCFRLLNSANPDSKEPVVYGDSILLESCKSPGYVLSVEEGFVRLLKKDPTKPLPKFTIGRHEEPPSKDGPTVQPLAIAGVDEQKGWYDKMQEGVKMMMEDSKEEVRVDPSGQRR
eukprot:comp11282_c0_seq1/m.5698 comp11282_c0_seq1/g.5698  ORF comp11282_c0_seq1/g.5698 comp11282_c0_seq1/m.5698 type:complete len:270 (-) comp11282_c0_seq1:309-1118(-)